MRPEPTTEGVKLMPKVKWMFFMLSLAAVTGLGVSAAAQSSTPFLEEDALPVSTNTFSLIDGPWIGPGVQTNPAWISEQGDIVGTYLDGNLMPHGFVKLRACERDDFEGRRAACGESFLLDAPEEGLGQRGGTRLISMDSFGTVLGMFTDSEGIKHGALWRRTCHSRVCTFAFQAFDAPGAGQSSIFASQGTFPSGISADGTIMGTYYDENTAAHTFVARQRPAPKSTDSNITLDFSEISILGDTTVYGFGISRNGIAIGEGCDASSCAGYVRPWRGRVIEFDPQQGGEIQPAAVNSFGVIVGEIFTLTPPYVSSFLRMPEGTITALDFEPVGINDKGAIVGGGGESITLRVPGGKEISLTPPSQWITIQPTAINDRGWIVGSVYDVNNQASGFVWKAGK